MYLLLFWKDATLLSKREMNNQSTWVNTVTMWKCWLRLNWFETNVKSMCRDNSSHLIKKNTVQIPIYKKDPNWMKW